MSCFTFRLEGHGVAPEWVEMNLNGPDEAQGYAVLAMGDLLRAAGAKFWSRPDWQVHVTDEAGQTVCTLMVQGRASLALIGSAGSVAQKITTRSVVA
jgi:hypothetical protein